MSDLTDLQDQTYLNEARDCNDRASLNLNSCSTETLLQILDAMRVYMVMERQHCAFTEEFSDIVSSIARKVNRSVW